jgi:signal transduction histidine kinase
VTSRIAHVDFSEKCGVNTHDEIEDLAMNINNMSDQLEATLNQLKYFLADASHELKTPLTVVKGIVEGLIDGVYDSGDVENYNKIIAEVNDMSGLVHDLLEISKMETGQVEISSNIFLLSDIVLDVHDKLQPLIKKKNIEVKLFLTDFFVEGDEERIKKVVRNLYTNAIKYTKSDGEILISTLDSDGRGSFEIKNSPARISDEDLNNLWKPFYRAEKSRNKSLGGSGLGLYMVKEILERHGAEYGIENFEDGVKAYFYISLKSSEIYINS